MVFWDLFRDEFYQFNIPCQPVDKTTTAGCIGIIADDGKTF